MSINDEEKVKARLSDVERALSSLEEQIFNVKNLLSSVEEQNMSPLDMAKVYLQMTGCPSDHAVYKDLDRVRSYMTKVKRIEQDLSGQKQRRINTDAASRFIHNALWEPPGRAKDQSNPNN